MKLFKVKIAVILGALLALFYFSSDFALIDIEKTAIVVSVGIDEGTNKNYKITAQIAIPQATDEAAANDDAVVTAEGNTVMEGIQNVGEKTGWHPKLSFCSLILIGKKIAEKGVRDIIDYFLVSEKVQNSAVVAMAEERADEILLSKTPLDAISSFAVSKIVLKSQWMTNTVTVANLKKIAVGEYSRSKASFMPVIKPIEEEDKSKEGGSGAQSASISPLSNDFGFDKLNNKSSTIILAADGSGGSGGGSGGSGGSGGEKDKVFDATSFAVFSDFKLKGELDKEETQIFNMLKGPAAETYLTIEKADEKILLQLRDNDRRVKVDFDNGEKVKIKLDFKVEIADSDKGYSLDKQNRRSVVDEETLDAATKKLNEILSRLIEKIKLYDTDILELKDYVYKFRNDKFQSFSQKKLSELKFSLSGKVYSLD